MLKKMLLISTILGVFLLYIPNIYAVQICETPSQLGVWDLADNATIDIPISFDVGDVATAAYAANSVQVDITHTYAGDLGGRLISPDNTNIHLWQLGDGSVPPSTGGSSCSKGGYDLLITDTAAQTLTNVTENSFCIGSNIDTDGGEAGGIGDPYTFSRSNPGSIGIQGTAKAIAPLSSFIGDSVTGNWNVRISDDFAADVGTINEVCLDLGFAGLDVEFFVSTNPTCSDRLESGSFPEGVTLFVCSSVVNKGTETFEVQSGDYSNDYGADYSSFETAYTMRDTGGASQSVITSFTTGSGTSYPVGSYTFNAGVTVTGTDTNFTGADTLLSNQSVTFLITDNIAPTITLLGSDPESVILSGGYTDAGATFSDNIDGTGSITASGVVDTNTPGTYILTYDYTDAGGNSAVQVTRTVNVLSNSPPTDMSISLLSVDENSPLGAIVGNFSTIDPDGLDTHTYTLVPGAGSTDNASFTISGSTLQVNASFDFETKNSYSIRVQTDDGNGGTFEKQFTITINDLDEIPPVDPTIASPVNNALVNTSTPILTGSGEITSLITITNSSGATIGTGTVDANGSYSIVTTFLIDGNHTIHADSTDAAGNTSGQASVDISIDTIAPNSPIVTFPTASSTTDGTVSGSAEALSTLNIFGPGGSSCSTTASSTGSYSCELAPLSDGSIGMVTATATDATGNTSSITTINPVTIDTIAPSSPTITSPTNGSPVIGTGEPGATVSVITPSGSSCNAVVTGGGSYSCTLSPIPVEAENISATQTDPAGNSSTSVIELSGIDIVSPTISFTDDVIVGPVQSDTLNISVTDTNPDTVTFEYGFSADTTCDASDTYGNTFTSTTDFILSTEANNGKYICARGSDLAGNTTYQVSVNPLNIDITDPIAPVVSTLGNNSTGNDNTPTFTGSGELGAIVSVLIDGTSYTGAVDGSGSWGIDVTSSLTDGDYIANVTQNDIAGNTSPATDVAIHIDTVAPTLAQVTAVATPDNDATPDYTFSTDEDAAISYGGSCSSVTGTGATGNITITLNTLADATYSDCTISMTDASGNTSSPLSISSFIVDTTLPIISLSGANPITLELGDTYSDAGATASDSVDGNVSSNIVIVNPVDPNTVGSYSVAYDVTDTAGNVATQVTRTVNVVDTTAPIFTIHDDVLVGPTQSDTVNISVSDLDLSPGTFEYGFSSDTVCNASDTFGTAFTSGIDITFNTETHNGDYLCFKAGDITGNTTYQISANPLNIDITPPVTPTNSPDISAATDSGNSNSDNETNDTTPDVSGTCTDGETVTLYIDGASDNSTVCSGGVYTLTPSSPLSEGNNNLTATFTDVAGNESSQSPIIVALIDTTPPGAPTGNDVNSTSDSGDSNTDNITNDTTPTLTGSGETGAIVSIIVNGVTQTGTVDVNGDWSIDVFPVLPDGDYTVSVRQTDTAGNISSPDSSFGITIDTTNNIPTLSSPIEGDNVINIAESTDVLVQGTAEANSNVVVTFQDGVHTPVIVNVATDISGNWTISGNEADVSAFDEGDIGVFVQTTDVAGNVSTTTSLTVLYDSSIPTLTGDITSTVTQTGASISWITDEISSSEVIYGLTTIIDQESGEQDISPRVTSHTVELTGLQECTIYFYKIESTDASGNILSNGIHTLTTEGCVGGAEVLEDTTTNIIATGLGATGGAGTIEVGSGSNLLEIDIPVGYFDTGTGSCAGDGAYFQLKQIERSPVVSTLGIPDFTTRALKAYDLSAYCNPGERVHTFDSAIRVTIHYSDEEVSGLNEQSMGIHRYNENTSSWEQLTNCSVDSVNNQVSCDTDHFSTFGIFGKSVGGGSGSFGSKDSCPAGDYSLSRYDGTCERDSKNTLVAQQDSEESDNSQQGEETQNREPTEELKSSDQKSEIPSSLNETQKFIRVKGVDNFYTLENDFNTCSIITDINNPEYSYNSSGVFIDENDSQYKQDILKFKAIGIVDGYDDATFQPYREMSRTEFLKVVLISHCYYYRDMDTTSLLYGDIDKASWQAKVVSKAQMLGIINGDTDDDGNPIFRPNDTISKAEAIKILMRMSLIQATDPVDLGYTDIAVSWHEGYIRTGESLGLFDAGVDRYNFTPDAPVLREDMIDLITRLVKLYR